MGIISTSPGSPSAIGATSGGKVYGFNALDAVTPTVVAPANSSRQKLDFHNPGTIDVIVFPSLIQTSGSSAANGATVAAKGGAFLVYANGGVLTVSGECQGEWKALAVSGTGNPLTVMDSNT